jgi:NADH-quinone oxidoreductase subunit N
MSDWMAILPEISLVLLAFVLLFLGMLKNEKVSARLGWVTAVGVTVIIAATILFIPAPASARTIWGGALRDDSAAYLFRILFLVAAALTALFAQTEEGLRVRGEFYFLMLISTLGMCLVAASADLTMLFLSIETISIPLYVMAGAKLKNERSVEAGIKYFLFGAMSSAILLYGLSLLYGFMGTTRMYNPVGLEKITQLPVGVLIVAVIMILGGFAFKISAVPFHFWTPDVYEGAPSPVAGFLSTASKAAGFVALMRLLFTVLGFKIEAVGLPILIAIAVASMFLGNLAAIQQKNVKRMIAYSSIAQAGYILIGVVSGSEFGISGAAYYLLAYLVTNLLVFAVIGKVEQATGTSDFDGFAGLNRNHAGLALAMLVGLLSLGGIPPFAGFFVKVLVFGAAVQANMAWLAIIGIVNSIIGLYYYLRLLKVMYISEPTLAWNVAGRSIGWVLALILCVSAVLILGVLYAPLYSWVIRAAGALLPL